MTREARAARVLGLLAATLAGSCAALRGGSTRTLAAVVLERDDAAPERVEEDLDRLEVAARRKGDAVQLFWTGFLQAQLHVAGSLDRPFRRESAEVERPVGIGERALGKGDPTRPSVVAHLIATVYHASEALSAADAARVAAKGAGGAVPPELAALGVDDAGENLRICVTTAYFRLGFRDQARRVLERSPELLEVKSCLALLERAQVRPALRPWVCAMAFDALRGSDELSAYRFGVLATEGGERFGRPLPKAAIDSIEEWIQHGASVRFVCPESGTPYLPGQTRSPISGVPQLDYVAVPRDHAP